MDCSVGPQLTPILVCERTEVTSGGWRLGDGSFGLDGCGLGLVGGIFSLTAVSSLLTRGIGGGGGDSLGFLFDSHRGRGTRGSGEIEEELQRHLVLSHSIV
jgi:hypothetical protein